MVILLKKKKNLNDILEYICKIILNIETGKYETVKSLNIKPSKIEAILPNYIYRFRKNGQFA